LVRLLARAALFALLLFVLLVGPALSASYSVQIKNFAFNPAASTVNAGDTVTWVNLDPALHRVHWTNGQFPDSPNLQQSQAYEVRFDTPGVYAYMCGIHPQMQGTVNVLRAVTTPTPTPVPRTTTPPPPPPPSPTTPTPAPTATETPTPTPSPSPSPSPTVSAAPTATPSAPASIAPSPSAAPLASPAAQTNTVVGVALIAVGVAILIGAFWWRFGRA
jgi:plastocyanin